MQAKSVFMTTHVDVHAAKVRRGKRLKKERNSLNFMLKQK